MICWITMDGTKSYTLGLRTEIQTDVMEVDFL